MNIKKGDITMEFAIDIHNMAFEDSFEQRIRLHPKMNTFEAHCVLQVLKLHIQSDEVRLTLTNTDSIPINMHDED